MGEISLGQFMKNVFDYGTGKPVQQQPGKVANENFQKAQTEMMNMVNQTARNITQNFVRQQDVLTTQMMLKELTNTERSWLMKNMFEFPENINQLLESLVTQGKNLTSKEIKTLMMQDLDLSKLLLMLQTNGKNAHDKLAKMITTLNQSGIFNTQQLKEMSVLINACIPTNDAAPAQILKSLMIMYLPWLPLNESIGFNFGSDEGAEGKKASGEDVITIILTTKNYGIIKILLYKEDTAYNMDVNCSEDFPKDKFNEILKGETAVNINGNPSYTVRKSETPEKSDEVKVEFSKSAKVSPQLLIIIHAIIKIVSQLDAEGSLQEARKQSL